MVAIVAASPAVKQVPFAVPIDISAGSVEGVTALDSADMDGDGLADVVVMDGGFHGEKKTFAWFKAPSIASDIWERHEIDPDAPLRPFIGAARLEDMNQDGAVDLVVASDNYKGEERKADVFVFVNPLHGMSEKWDFHYAVRSLPCHHINDMAVADMDQDGRMDVVVRSLEPNEVHVLFQNSLEDWSIRSISTGLERSEGLAVGCLNEDAFPEITFTGNVLTAPGDPRTGEYTRIPVDPEYASINQNTKEAIGDVDGDGRLDLVMSPAEHFREGRPHDLAWYRNPGGDLSGPWEKHVVVPLTNDIHTLKLARMNPDPYLDIVAGTPWQSKSVKIYYNLGDGRFSDPQVVSDENGLYSGVVIDFDGDGDVDIIGQESYSGSSRPYLYESLIK